MLNHIRLDFYHNIEDNETNFDNFLTTEFNDSDLKVHALHYANGVPVPVRLSKTFANSLNMQKQYKKLFGKRVMTCTRGQ